MRVFVLAVLVLLSSCGERKPSKFEMLKAAEEQEYARAVDYHLKSGLPREKAELLARSGMRTDEEIRRFLYEQEQKEAEIQALHDATCQQTPYLDRCQ